MLEMLFFSGVNQIGYDRHRLLRRRRREYSPLEISLLTGHMSVRVMVAGCWPGGGAKMNWVICYKTKA